MTLYEQIKKDLKGFGRSNDYYRDWLFSKVGGHYTTEPKPGQMIFFSYFAGTANRLDWYDKYPLVMVTETTETHFMGGNLHYVSPILRKSIGKHFQSGGMEYPLKMHHKYLRIYVNSPLFVIDEVEWADIGLIPVEYFVKVENGRTVKVSSSQVWNS